VRSSALAVRPESRTRRTTNGHTEHVACPTRVISAVYHEPVHPRARRTHVRYMRRPATRSQSRYSSACDPSTHSTTPGVLENRREISAVSFVRLDKLSASARRGRFFSRAPRAILPRYRSLSNLSRAIDNRIGGGR